MDDLDDLRPTRELVADHRRGHLSYRQTDDHLYLLHTEVHPFYRGDGTAAGLVTAAVDLAAQEHLVIVPWCPFARQWLRRHPDVAGRATIDWTVPVPTAMREPMRGP